LWDAARSGHPGKVTQVYKQQLLLPVRQRPSAFGVLLVDSGAALGALGKPVLSGEGVGQHLKAADLVRSPGQHKISSPDAEYQVKKRRWKKNAIS